MGLFPRLGPESIELVSSGEAAAAAFETLQACPLLGFDTESRPVFVAGELAAGPHVVQFATAERAWIFQLQDGAARQCVARLLASSAVVKAGFGLEGDLSQIQRLFGTTPAGLVDLNTVFRRRGLTRHLGARSAVAVMFGQRLVKSKRMTTSNWGATRLSEAQLVYAANDAFAAYRVCQALGLSPAELLDLCREEPAEERKDDLPRHSRWRRRRRNRPTEPTG
jgi:ribonuclease D